MGLPVWVWVAGVVVAGVLLVLGSARATATVTEGPVFLRWMLVVFAAFLVLAAIPILVGG